MRTECGVEEREREEGRTGMRSGINGGGADGDADGRCVALGRGKGRGRVRKDGVKREMGGLVFAINRDWRDNEIGGESNSQCQFITLTPPKSPSRWIDGCVARKARELSVLI